MRNTLYAGLVALILAGCATEKPLPEPIPVRKNSYHQLSTTKTNSPPIYPEYPLYNGSLYGSTLRDPEAKKSWGKDVGYLLKEIAEEEKAKKSIKIDSESKLEKALRLINLQIEYLSKPSEKITPADKTNYEIRKKEIDKLLKN